MANQVVSPPLNDETLTGFWEALAPEYPPELWHMEINGHGDSYLVELSVGGKAVLRKLVSSQVKDGEVRLHFGKGLVEGQTETLWKYG